MSSYVPGYLALLESGELARRVEQAYRHLATCDVCARHCPANRQIGELGACRTGMQVGVAGYGPRRDEEKALRGKHGSGTILFSRCSLVCRYCRERDHAADDGERLVEPEELAAMMMELQGRGCPTSTWYPQATSCPRSWPPCRWRPGRGYPCRSCITPAAMIRWR